MQAIQLEPRESIHSWSSKQFSSWLQDARRAIADLCLPRNVEDDVSQTASEDSLMSLEHGIDDSREGESDDTHLNNAHSQLVLASERGKRLPTHMSILSDVQRRDRRLCCLSVAASVGGCELSAVGPRCACARPVIFFVNSRFRHRRRVTWLITVEERMVVRCLGQCVVSSSTLNEGSCRHMETVFVCTLLFFSLSLRLLVSFHPSASAIDGKTRSP